MYKYQSCGAKPLMNVWAKFVIKTQTAKILSGILSQTLKIRIPITVPVKNNIHYLAHGLAKLLLTSEFNTSKS
jgi:hypothetical protein